MTAKTGKSRQSLYFSEEMLKEIRHEAARIDRSLSWTVQRAWKLAKADLKKIPGTTPKE